jgi:ligand-binding sensor domain-containing protein
MSLNKLVTFFTLLFALSVFNEKSAHGQTYSIESFSSYNFITSFADAGDSIWFGTQAGVAIYHKQQNYFEFLTNCNSGLKDNNITTLVRQNNGVIWIGTQYSGLFCFNGSSWTVYNNANSPLNCDSIRCLKTDNLGNLWVAADILYKFDGTTWTPWPHIFGIPLSLISSLETDASNQLWIGTRLNGLFLYNGSTWKHFTQASTGISGFNMIRKVYFDHSNKLWVICSNKLYSFNNGLFQSLVTPSFIQLSVIDIDSDTLGNLWISNDTCELLKYDGNTWNMYGVVEFPWLKNGTEHVFVDREQRKWLHNPFSGIARLDNGNLLQYNFTPSLPGNIVKDIELLDNSTAYFATNSGLPENDITALFFDAGGKLWTGTRKSGLSSFNDTTWTNYNMVNSCLPGNSIFCINEDAAHKIWVGTDNGAALLTPDIIVGNHHQKLEQTNNIRVFPNPASDNAWVGFSHKPSKGKLLVRSLEGQQIIEQLVSQGEMTPAIQLSGLPAGIYLVQYISGLETASCKLIIAR